MERYLRDARGLGIGGGPTQIQRNMIAGEVTGAASASGGAHVDLSLTPEAEHYGEGLRAWVEDNLLGNGGTSRCSTSTNACRRSAPSSPEHFPPAASRLRS